MSRTYIAFILTVSLYCGILCLEFVGLHNMEGRAICHHCSLRESVRFASERSRVRIPSSPPFRRYANPWLGGQVAVYRNVFALVVEFIDYEGETYFQAKSATYKEIQAWVKKTYGLHVSNLAISWTKERCGVTKAGHKDQSKSKKSYAAELTPEKEAAIKEAFICFGMMRPDKK